MPRNAHDVPRSSPSTSPAAVVTRQVIDVSTAIRRYGSADTVTVIATSSVHGFHMEFLLPHRPRGVRPEYALHLRSFKRQKTAKMGSRGLPKHASALRSQNEGVRLALHSYRGGSRGCAPVRIVESRVVTLGGPARFLERDRPVSPAGRHHRSSLGEARRPARSSSSPRQAGNGLCLRI